MADRAQAQNSRSPQRLDWEDGPSASKESDSFGLPSFKEVCGWLSCHNSHEKLRDRKLPHQVPGSLPDCPCPSLTSLLFSDLWDYVLIFLAPCVCVYMLVYVKCVYTCGVRVQYWVSFSVALNLLRFGDRISH